MNDKKNEENRGIAFVYSIILVVAVQKKKRFFIMNATYNIKCNYTMMSN